MRCGSGVGGIGPCCSSSAARWHGSPTYWSASSPAEPKFMSCTHCFRGIGQLRESSSSRHWQHSQRQSIRLCQSPWNSPRCLHVIPRNRAVAQRDPWAPYTFTTQLVGVLGLDHWQIGHVHVPRPAHPRIAPQCVGPDPLTLEPSFLLSYCAAARIGMCALRKRRTWSIVRCLSSSGSFHG